MRFLEVFIPLFVSIDAIGMIPVFVAVTSEMDDRERRHVSATAVTSASLICLGFMFVGNQLFAYLGVRAEHFMIAGGVILLVLSVLDIVIFGKPAMDPEQVVGIVPLGMPLIAGPATLSTVLLLSSDARPHSYAWTALGLATNLGILLIVLMLAGKIARWVGLSALRAMSKIVMVLLAAIAVRFIADGVQTLIHNAK